MRRPTTLALLALASALGAAPGCTREKAPPPEPGPAVAAPTGPAAPAPAAVPGAPHPVHPPAPDWGEPDMPKVERLFRSRFAEVKRCYEAELQRHPESSGKLTLRFTIDESGALRHVAVARTTFRRRDVPSCVAEVVRRWRTPFRPAEPVEVEYPFSFSPR